ncbi:MAG: 4Fe-4S dicluster domain-containing protein [Sulfitobacter sp.]|nr:4Fe-4S dicluster domain-containing protein [Sulfitobacter sp.]
MPRQNPHRPYAPSPHQKSLFPAVSGNDINGWGEDEPRRPRMVYWAPDPDDIPHGTLQRYFYTQGGDAEARARIRAERQEILDAPLPETAARQVDQGPDDWARGLAAFVDRGFCEKTGIAPLDPSWLYEGQETDLPRVVMIGVAHDYGTIAQAPDEVAGTEVIRQYARAARAAKEITGWIRSLGWRAEAATGPMTGALTMIPPALACGFGELGKHGSIICPEYGASFRLSAVLTDAPFAPTPPKDHGIDAFCQNCRICEDACPPEALFPEKQTVRGAQKWYVDFDKCLPFFNDHSGCAICIAVCPWSRPGVGLNLAAKLARRAERG